MRWLSTVQPSMSGRKISSVMATGLILPRQAQGQPSMGGDDALEPLLPHRYPGALAHNGDRPPRSARSDRRAACVSRSSGMSSNRCACCTSNGACSCSSGTSARRIPVWRPHIGLRQIQRKGAALAGSAHKSNFAAQQHGQLSADRQTEAGSAESSARAGIGLLERLEDDLLLLDRNADAGIAHFKRHHRRHRAQHRMIQVPAGHGPPDRGTSHGHEW